MLAKPETIINQRARRRRGLRRLKSGSAERERHVGPAAGAEPRATVSE